MVVSGQDGGRVIAERAEAFVGGVVARLRRPEQRRNAFVYVRGMLVEGPRKSLEPTVVRLGGGAVEYEALQHFLADARWDWELVMRSVCERVAPQIVPLAWVLDDSGWVKEGNKSPGVARQYSGTLGKIGNCQIGVSLHAAGRVGTLPLGWQLYLPEVWCEDTAEARERRRKAKIPEGVVFATKPQQALELARRAAGWAIQRAPVLGDAAYGRDGDLRAGLHELGLEYVLSIDPPVTFYDADTVFAVPPRQGTKGRSPTKPQPDRPHRSAQQIALSLGSDAFQPVCYREQDSRGKRRVGRFAFERVIAVKPIKNGKDAREEWLIIEWPVGRDKPTDYWISNLPADADHEQLAKLCRLRWTIELDYKQLKGHLGLDHYEGRSWGGWHKHATLVTVAHAFLTEERLHPKAQRPS